MAVQAFRRAPRDLPLRDENLPFARPDITEEEIDAVVAVMKSGWLTSGPEVQQFEKEFASAVGAKHALALNSATAALHLGMVAWNIGPDDAVLVPSITFTATAEVIGYSGGMPLIVDVNRSDYLLDASIIEEFIKKQCRYRNKKLTHISSGRRIRGIIPVHLAGKVCDMDALLDLGEKYGLHIMEDAAHAFPASRGEKKVGSISELTAFSFYATKNMTTGEGGMLTTNLDALANRLRRVRLHGIQGQTYGRKRWKYDVVDLGYKYNMTDMAAAMGRIQLKRTEQMQRRRNEIVNTYRNELGNLPALRLPEVCPGEANHLFTVEITDESPMNRDRFVEEMYSRKIGTSLHFIPLYRHTYYKKKLGLKGADFPNSEDIYSRIVSLPLYTAMTDSDVLDVATAVREILG